jgi:hypothetical protein
MRLREGEQVSTLAPVVGSDDDSPEVVPGPADDTTVAETELSIEDEPEADGETES